MTAGKGKREEWCPIHDAENQNVSDSYLCRPTDSIFKFGPSEIPIQFYSLMIAKFGRFLLLNENGDYHNS